MIHFFTSGVDVGEVGVNRTNYQGCQFDVHFIQSQISTDTSRGFSLRYIVLYLEDEHLFEIYIASS